MICIGDDCLEILISLIFYVYFDQRLSSVYKIYNINITFNVYFMHFLDNSYLVEFSSLSAYSMYEKFTMISKLHNT